MATTKSIPQDLDTARQDVIFNALAANTTIPMGALAVNDAGVAKNATDTLIQGGAKLLGMAAATYENPTGSTLTKRMLFFRSTAGTFAGKAGDLPVAADVGGSVFISDNATVKKTDAGSDLAVTLVKIDGTNYRVRLP